MENIVSQHRAFSRRDEIRPGDKFLWHFQDGYCTSGKLPRKYMRASSGWGEGDRILTVCGVYIGHNGYGDFVDYHLSPSGSPSDARIIIINGPDAFRMQRAE